MEVPLPVAFSFLVSCSVTKPLALRGMGCNVIKRMAVPIYFQETEFSELKKHAVKTNELHLNFFPT